MRRSRLIFIAIVAVIIVALILYRLHGVQKFQVFFSEDGLIVSDNGEPYEDGVQGVHVGFTKTGVSFST